MLTRDFRDRLDALTDELLADQDVEAAFLASVLLRVQDALSDGTIASLSLRLWRSDPDREVDRLRPECDGIAASRSLAGSMTSPPTIDPAPTDRLTGSDSVVNEGDQRARVCGAAKSVVARVFASQNR
jgi:hypothetical protein